jgi:hypothetical protein
MDADEEEPSRGMGAGVQGDNMTLRYEIYQTAEGLELRDMNGEVIARGSLWDIGHELMRVQVTAGRE